MTVRMLLSTKRQNFTPSRILPRRGGGLGGGAMQPGVYVWGMVLRCLNGLLLLSLIVLQACATVEKPASELAPPTLTPAENMVKKPRISDLVLGPGDVMEITVYRQDDLNKKIQIPPDGRIFYPFVGEVQAAGMSVVRLRDKLTEGLSPYVMDPQVSVAVTALRSEKVFILGEVERPGIFALESGMSVLEAISGAGGFTKDAKWSNVLLIRNGLERPQLASLDLKKTLKQGDLSQNVTLASGDILYVPPVFIADVSRFARHLEFILRPILMLEQGIFFWPQVTDAITGTETETSRTIVITPVIPSQ
jgi:polysaccharide export outer membrane protein